METTKVDVDALTTRFLECTPPLDAEGRRISIALYRSLAEGEPVLAGELATKVGLDAKRLHEILRSWPGLFYDERGRVQGYWGLGISKTKHELEVRGKTLYTWCAWDGLFLPEILQKTARVRSSCPVTGETIRLRVHPNRIETVDPADAVMSFPRARCMEVGEDVVGSFCRFVHFFRAPEAADAWLERRPGHLALSSRDAFELAKRKNARQYGALDREAAPGRPRNS